MYALRLELEGEQALVGQLEAQLNQLAAAEQAAAADAAAVRSALQAALLMGGRQGGDAQAGAPLEGMQSAAASAEAAAPSSNSSSSLGKQVGTAVAALLERVRLLERQVAQQQAALEQAQQRPAMAAAAVQCDSQARSDAAMQAEPGSAVPASTQTEAAGLESTAGGGTTAGYGQAHPEQQQIAQLTQQLADARLAAVAAKAEQAAAQSKLQDAERQVDSAPRKIWWLCCAQGCNTTDVTVPDESFMHPRWNCSSQSSRRRWPQPSARQRKLAFTAQIAPARWLSSYALSAAGCRRKLSSCAALRQLHSSRARLAWQRQQHKGRHSCR